MNLWQRLSLRHQEARRISKENPKASLTELVLIIVMFLTLPAMWGLVGFILACIGWYYIHKYVWRIEALRGGTTEPPYLPPVRRSRSAEPKHAADGGQSDEDTTVLFLRPPEQP